MRCDNAHREHDLIDVMACRWWSGKPPRGGRVFLGMQRPGETMCVYMTPGQAEKLAGELLQLAAERRKDWGRKV